MARDRSLRRRIVGAFSLFAFGLAVLFAGTVYGVLFMSEDLVQQRQLRVELNSLLETPDLLRPGTVEINRHMNAYVGLARVPDDLRDLLAPLAPGVHEIGNFSDPPERELHVAVSALGGSPHDLYVVFDVEELEATRTSDLVLFVALLIGISLVSSTGVVVGLRLARTVVAPVADLAHEVQTAEPSELPDRIDPSRYADEIAVLAGALRDATARLREFVDRERQFTANASHELRTPVTVISGATELLEASQEISSPVVRRPVERIRRATRAMEEIIELFLALAREETFRDVRPNCPLSELIEDAVEGLQGQIEQLPLQVIIEVPDELTVPAPERALSIVLSNLIGNAVERTEHGSVQVRWFDGALEIKDSGPGIPKTVLERATERHVRGSGDGYGLGLSIVATLCERCGWQLELDSTEGVGTTVTVRLT